MSRINIHKRCFFNFYSCLSILEFEETQNESPTQTSRHSTVRQKSIFPQNFYVKTLLVTKSHQMSNMIYKDYYHGF